MKKLKFMLLPILVGIVFSLGFGKFLDKKNNELMSSKDMYSLLYDTKSLVKDKGVYANNILSKNGYILMMGSSELSHSTKQHPDYYFNTGRTKNGVITIGRAYSQSLQHASLLGGLDPDIKNKKVVLLLSMQWFMEKEGVTKHHFQTRFSPIQFYRFLENQKISDDLKVKYASRVRDLLDDGGDFKDEKLYADFYVNEHSKKPSNMKKIAKFLLNPYFFVRERMVSLKDKGILYESLVTIPRKDEVNTSIDKKIDWKKERSLAIEDAKKRVGREPRYLGKKRIYLDTGYYKKIIRPKQKKSFRAYDNIDIENSVEYSDLDIFFKVCKQEGIKPTVVLIPGMSEYYDYTGIDKKERAAYYDKIKKIVASYNFNMVDISKNENTRYYLRDVMHLGTLGWVDVCEKIYNIYERL